MYKYFIPILFLLNISSACAQDYSTPEKTLAANINALRSGDESQDLACFHPELYHSPGPEFEPIRIDSFKIIKATNITKKEAEVRNPKGVISDALAGDIELMVETIGSGIKNSGFSYLMRNVNGEWKIVNCATKLKLPEFILKYSICKNNVVDAVASYDDHYHTVNIRLTPSATKEFAEFTEQNIGKYFEILFKGEAVTWPFIKDKISSGSIQLKVKSKKEADTLAKDILNYAPQEPCGVVNQ